MNNKQKIILAALELFAENGYTETSIDKIAKRANVSKGLTYNHFKNKEELLVATIENTITRLTSEMMEIKELSFHSFFTSFFESLKVNTKIIRLCTLLIVHPQTPSKIISLLEKQKHELLELFSVLLQDKYKQNSRTEAAILLATIDGITLDYTTNPNPDNLSILQQYLIEKYTK
ncbi:DNA-binding transcriptional regulator, AcrR family [Tenacibaculum sp. MAR_2009_124]|uniref:TetR/AcrR family transcriptional regulator n=1 Tax=Tenacibaculum sp. MAR_2009_124 TaxID=1250059 RepID=UPI0008995F8C|nr:TetR/AcrR family transcriptional regulator [Tenacibaculum sp. MAR_2009_124]SED05772.1 DNA-binding transcriptional regulator, AcrR family [Tenacibaculum sp. MAR_2009_124]